MIILKQCYFSYTNLKHKTCLIKFMYRSQMMVKLKRAINIVRSEAGLSFEIHSNGFPFSFMSK